MKKHTKILSLILAVIMIMSVMPMTASADEATINVGEHITLTWDNNDTLVISGSGAMSESMTEELQNYLINVINPKVKKLIVSEDVLITDFLVTICQIFNSDLGSYPSKFECIEVAETNPLYCSVDGIMYSKDMTELIFYPRRLNATSFIIPNAVKTIGKTAFYWCDNLESIVMSDNVQTIGYGAFGYCFNLKNIETSNNLRVIDEYAFYGCRNLEEINIPQGVETINLFAFAGCENLSEVHFSKNLKKILIGAFTECNALEQISYCGTADDWKKIIIEGNEIINVDDALLDATILFDTHVNKNGDLLCDGCGILLTNCSCNCHSTNSFISFFWKILNFFQRIFGTNRTCECGMAHY